MGRIKRRIRRAGVYFVTTETWQRRPLFAKPEPGRILLEQLLRCRDRGFYRLHAFVVMPQHLHALLTPGEETTLEKAMQMIKGGSAYEIRKQVGYKLPVWQSGFHDRWIRNCQEYVTRKRYIERNPVVAKLVLSPEQYALSSATGHFALDKSSFDES